MDRQDMSINTPQFLPQTPQQWMGAFIAGIIIALGGFGTGGVVAPKIDAVALEGRLATIESEMTSMGHDMEELKRLIQSSAGTAAFVAKDARHE